MKKVKFIIVLIVSFFSVSFTSNVFSVNNVIQVEKSTPEEYDEGYEEGYCEGFKEAQNNPHMACPKVPYIDNSKYLSGCQDWKCGYNAGFKHGQKDGGLDPNSLKSQYKGSSFLD